MKQGKLFDFDENHRRDNQNVGQARLPSLPTTTVHQARLQIYQPTRKPKNLIRKIDTPWGTGIVDGKTGMAHADLMEGIFKHAEKYQIIKNSASIESDPIETMEILVDPYKLRTTSRNGSRLSGAQVEALCDDLVKVMLDIKGTAQFRPIKGHMIDLIVSSRFQAVSRPGTIQGKKPRYMWYVKVGAPFVRFIKEDLHLHYDPQPIAELNTGIAQAVARHLATHTHEPNGGWHIDKLILAVGAGKTSKAMWERRNEILEDHEGLQAIGFIIEERRIKRKRQDRLPGVDARMSLPLLPTPLAENS